MGMGGRSGLALGSLLVGGGLVVGAVIGRSTAPRTARASDVPSLASTREAQELTDTVPLAPPVAVEAPPAPAIVAPPPAPAPAVAAAPPATPPPAATPDASAAPAPEVEQPEPPPPVAAAPEPPPPDPALISQGRAFHGDEITRSSFDDDDVSEYSVVPDHEVTSSSFDDDDRANDHPTGE